MLDENKLRSITDIAAADGIDVTQARREKRAETGAVVELPRARHRPETAPTRVLRAKKYQQIRVGTLNSGGGVAADDKPPMIANVGEWWVVRGVVVSWPLPRVSQARQWWLSDAAKSAVMFLKIVADRYLFQAR